MRVITWARIRAFIEEHPNSASRLRAWRTQIERETLANAAQLKDRFPYVSIVNNRRVVFNIKGNDYRLIVDVRYDLRRVYVRGVYTHDEYDRIDVEKV